MKNWVKVRAADFIEFNPRLSIKKGEIDFISPFLYLNYY